MSTIKINYITNVPGTGPTEFLTGATVTGNLYLSNGTISYPSVAFLGSTTSGFYSPAADTISVGISGAETLRVNSTGFFANNTVSGYAAIAGDQYFKLAADGSAIGSAIADFFGTNSSIALEASSVYEIVAYCVFTKTTAGTATWTITASSAPTRISGTYNASPVTGIAAGTPVTGYTGSQASTTAAFAATASLTTGVNHAFYFVTQIQTAAATNWRLRLTQSAGTATPLAGSYYRVRKIPTTTGIFAA